MSSVTSRLPRPTVSVRGRPLPSGPLAGRYPAAAAMVVLFLVPYLGLSSALGPIQPLIAQQLHMSAQTISLASGMANAAYALGTVLAVQFAQHLPQRRMGVGYAVLLLVGSVLTAAATNSGMFIAGHILQGLCTSLLLIAATPALLLGYPASRLRWTSVIFDMCIFGAVAAGPLIGGAQASFHAWRPLFWIMAGIAAVALLLSLVTFQDAPPADRSALWHPSAIALASGGSVAAFWGASELTTHRFLDPVAIIPLLGGLALIIILWVYQYRAKRPLLTIRPLISTIPVTGIVTAVCAAAAATSAIALTATVLAPRYTPLHLGLLYVPELGAAVITAIAFGALFSTRLLHYYALAGMVLLAAGIGVFRVAIPPTTTTALVGSGLTGAGIGASVVPALYLAGFSLRSASIQRVFAILELLRAWAAFMVVPILLHFATTAVGTPTAAMGTALWVCLGLTAGGALVGICLYLLGRVRPPAPSLATWVRGEEPAWTSTPLLALPRGIPASQPLDVRSEHARDDRGGRPAVHPVPGLRRWRAARGRDGQPGPVLFAYDGSASAMDAINEAGRQFPVGRDTLILTVWRTFSVGFLPGDGAEFDAASGEEVRQAAGRTAAHGASLAKAAGFRARSTAVEGAPTWKAIVDAADENQASMIILGARRHAGPGVLAMGSVAAAVAAHTRRPVLIVHGQGLYASRQHSPCWTRWI
jgi:nucleotide-binding universal stress UspA family protein/MFS family permease